ncbi:MAG TPA: Gfo/Idh/MocA family oxidoreductase [Methylomirabilota bacterium]|nr:Gfo/Idh/MocA family oxidoreductase [Methylomirabilota bacterium]
MVRVIQVGLGLWGLNWAEEVFPQVPDAEIVALVDPSDDALERARAVLGVEPGRCYHGLAEAAAAAPADLVVATVRTQAHHPVVMEALSLGLHALVEKPFASTLAEAREMIASADNRGRVLMVNQNYRFHPAPIYVAGLVAREALGPVNMVSVDFRRHGPSQGYRYWDMPHPLLADMSIHHFDLMRMVLGSNPKRVSCRTWNPGNTPFVHDPLGVATIEFEDETMVSYRGSWISGGENTPWAGEWSMDCGEGEIWWTSRDQSAGRPPGPDRVTIKRLGEAATEPALPIVALADRAGALNAMLTALATGTPPPRFSSGRDNIMSLALVESSILSASRRGDWVEVAELLG